MRDISAVVVLKSNAVISADDVKELNDNNTFPDLCFLNPFVDQLEDSDGEQECTVNNCNTYNDDDAKFCKACGTRLEKPGQSEFKVSELSWCGDNSGGTWHRLFVKKVAAKIHGDLDAICVLGSADDDEPVKLMGIQLRDGTVTRCDVDCVLRPARGE